MNCSSNASSKSEVRIGICFFDNICVIQGSVNLGLNKKGNLKLDNQGSGSLTRMLSYDLYYFNGIWKYLINCSYSDPFTTKARRHKGF